MHHILRRREGELGRAPREYHETGRDVGPNAGKLSRYQRAEKDDWGKVPRPLATAAIRNH